MLGATCLTAIILIQQLSSGQSLSGLMASNFATLQHEPNHSLAALANNTGTQFKGLGTHGGYVTNTIDAENGTNTAYDGNVTKTTRWLKPQVAPHVESLMDNYILVGIDRYPNDEPNYSKHPFRYFHPSYPHNQVFSPHKKSLRSENPIQDFFQSGSRLDWTILVVEIGVCILFDIMVIQRLPSTPRFNILAVVLWIVMALFCSVGIFCRSGFYPATEWIMGYILEWVFSLENIFVFHLVFKCFRTPPSSLHTAVFLGLMGAILMRMAFFLTVSSLLDVVTWVRWPFGLLLVWSGYQVAVDDDEEYDMKDSTLVKILEKCFGSMLFYGYDGNKCFTWNTEGRFQVTLLVIVIICIQFMDLVFALDSVSAKVANIKNLYIAFSSTVIAMFGLRSMFFIIKDLAEMFHMMKYGLAMILVFAGVQISLYDTIHIKTVTVCTLILSVLIISIVSSVIKQPMSEPPAAATLEATCTSISPPAELTREATCKA